MLTARVTDIEQHRRYRTDEDYPMEDLLGRLRRETPPSLKMRAGTALHKILEFAESHHTTGDDVCEASADGFLFDFSGMTGDALPLAPWREIEGEKVYTLESGEQIRIVGHVDALYGRVIDDHKLSDSFDAEMYADSYQWRLYLDIFDADTFTFNVFKSYMPEPHHCGDFTPTCGHTDAQVCEACAYWDSLCATCDYVCRDHSYPIEVNVKELNRLTFYRYPEMQRDILRELALYADFARHHLTAHAA